jgi:hypothetical protein
MKGCNAAQSAGASLSYLKRYQYQSIIGQPSEDNDVSSEGFKKNDRAAAPTPKAKVAEPKAAEAKAAAPEAAAPKRGGFKTKTLGAKNVSSEL